MGFVASLKTRPIGRAVFLLLAFFAADPAIGSPNPWAEMALQDLQGIHQGLLENHPGPVDPQNPSYKAWLENGLRQAQARAQTAKSYSDYIRTLRFYTNGFEDGHIGIYPNLKVAESSWPGFVIGGASMSDAHVIFAEKDAGAPAGARVLSCDGQTIDQLMARRVDPYYWNRAIPQERQTYLYRLFYQDATDPAAKLRTCRFSSGDVTLAWRDEKADALQQIIAKARGVGVGAPRLKKIDGIWLVSIPTFNFETEADIAGIKNVIAQIKENAASLRKSTIVFDMRGNTGGDSSWGDQLINAFWGDGWADKVEARFDNSVDWRASPNNLNRLDEVIIEERKEGLTESAAYWSRTRDAIKAAMAKGQLLAHVADPPHAGNDTLPRNPVTGAVYVLTDNECASACLDFLDVMRRIPGVTHAGLPTSADAIYIDTNHWPLPSGIVHLNYGMKVFRHRVRGNNEWYEPKIRWPGGDMTDDTIAQWIVSLRQKG